MSLEVIIVANLGVIQCLVTATNRVTYILYSKNNAISNKYFINFKTKYLWANLKNGFKTILLIIFSYHTTLKNIFSIFMGKFSNISSSFIKFI